MQSLPGLALAVTDRDGLIASETFGHANLDAGTPVTSETYFEHGSIGKTFTASCSCSSARRGWSTSKRP